MKNQLFFLHPVVVEDKDESNNGMAGSKSMDSINSYGNGLDDNDQGDDIEKARLISQVLELQNTLDDLNQRVDGVKEENLRLRSENMVLGQYIGECVLQKSVYWFTMHMAATLIEVLRSINFIYLIQFSENLMSASSVFSSTTSPSSMNIKNK